MYVPVHRYGHDRLAGGCQVGSVGLALLVPQLETAVRLGISALSVPKLEMAAKLEMAVLSVL